MRFFNKCIDCGIYKNVCPTKCSTTEKLKMDLIIPILQRIDVHEK